MGETQKCFVYLEKPQTAGTSVKMKMKQKYLISFLTGLGRPLMYHSFARTFKQITKNSVLKNKHLEGHFALKSQNHIFPPPCIAIYLP